MPVQSNPAIQNVPSLAFADAISYPTDIRKFLRFGWSFQVLTTLAADAVFNIEYADPSDADPCVPGPWSPVAEVAACEGGAEGDQATITLPAGTEEGAICSGTIPCKPGAFVRLTSASGPTDQVVAIAVRQGPMMG